MHGYRYNIAQVPSLVTILCLSLYLHGYVMNNFPTQYYDLLQTLVSWCSTVGIPPEASTAVTMQANPSYIAMEEGVALEPNPCYSTVQANSVYEPTSDHGEDQL